MITRRPLFLLLTAIAAGASMTSCNHKDLCYEESEKSRLFVAYDWSEAPDASPAGMCVYFYSIDNGNYYRFDFANTTGGEIELPAGTYRLISYNNDTELVKFSATNDYDKHFAYTRSADLLEPLYGNGVSSSIKTDNGENVVMTPDGLWGCHVTDVVVSEHGVKYTYTDWFSNSRAESETENDQTITLFPHDMLCHYSYEVRNVENADHVSRISASLSGMSGTLQLSDESLGTERVTLPVAGQANPSVRKITGQFLTFGHYGTATAEHKMTFYVVMDDGSKYVVKDIPNLDVTTQVDDAPDRRHVHIIIDGLQLPDSKDNEEGWIPTVDDWGVKEEDLKI